jgi:hypothetical protein
LGWCRRPSPNTGFSAAPCLLAWHSSRPANWAEGERGGCAGATPALIGNTGFRRYLKTIREQRFAIDPDKIEEERKFDGIVVLRTNTDLNPLEAVLCYKEL